MIGWDNQLVAVAMKIVGFFAQRDPYEPHRMATLAVQAEIETARRNFSMQRDSKHQGMEIQRSVCFDASKRKATESDRQDRKPREGRDL